MRRQRRDQRKGQRHMHIKPDFEQRADLEMPAQPRQRRLLLLEQTNDLLARLAVAAVGERQRAQRRRGRAIGIAARQPRHDAARERILVERREYGRGVGGGQRLRGTMQLAIESADRLEHLHLRHLVAVVRQRSGQSRIDDDAIEPREDHQHHQRPSEGMNIPAELEPRMPGADDDQAEPEIDMRRRPRL